MANALQRIDERAEQMARDTTALCDHLRSQASRAAPEAREALDHLLAQLGDIAEDLRNAAQKAHEESLNDDERLQLELGFRQAADRWEHLKPFLSELARDLGQRGQQALGAVERARVDEELKRMQASSIMEERMEQTRQALAAGRSEAQQQMGDILDDIQNVFQEVWNRFPPAPSPGSEAHP